MVNSHCYVTQWSATRLCAGLNVYSPGGGGCSLIWPIRGCATGQGMVFVLSVLNRVYNSARVCSRQGIQFRGSLSTVRMICVSLFYYKEGTNIKGLVLNRVSILGIFCPKMGQGFKPSATYLYPNIGRVPPPPGCTATPTPGKIVVGSPVIIVFRQLILVHLKFDRISFPNTLLTP